MKEKKIKKSPVSVICSSLGTILLVVLIIGCIPFTLPKILNYQAYTVISGSMEPEIETGSLVYIGPVEPQDVQVDDVIAFYGGRDSNAIITHRVVENRVIMGEFITKGDANQTNDMNPVPYDELIGRVELIIPKFGVVAQMLSGVQGKIAAGCMIALAVVLHGVAAVLDRTKKEKD